MPSIAANLAKKLSLAEVAQNRLVTKGGTHDDTNLTLNYEEHIARGITDVHNGLARSIALPAGPGGKFSQSFS